MTWNLLVWRVWTSFLIHRWPTWACRLCERFCITAPDCLHFKLTVFSPRGGGDIGHLPVWCEAACVCTELAWKHLDSHSKLPKSGLYEINCLTPVSVCTCMLGLTIGLTVWTQWLKCNHRHKLTELRQIMVHNVASLMWRVRAPDKIVCLLKILVAGPCCLCLLRGTRSF